MVGDPKGSVRGSLVGYILVLVGSTESSPWSRQPYWHDDMWQSILTVPQLKVYFPASVVPIQKNWSQDDWGSISEWCIQGFLSTITHGNRSLLRLLSQTSRRSEDFLPALLRSLRGWYHGSLFPIPYNPDANAIRGISEYPPLLSVGPIIGIDGRSWLGYEYLSDMCTLGLLFHRSFHFPFWTNS